MTNSVSKVKKFLNISENCHPFKDDHFQNEFDVVITDSSDPVGPAESLFGASYYELLRDALREGGILSSQG